MKFKSSILILLVALTAACKSVPAEIPTGKWNYDLMVNGVKAGSAVFSNEKNGDIYISKSEMYLNVGSIENKSVQIIKETSDFKPVSLEILNTVTDRSSGKVQEINKTATFNGNEVNIVSEDYRGNFKIATPFVLDGNFFFNELLKKKFKSGTVVKSYIYEPSVELDEPILVIVELAGYEDVDVNGVTKSLMHVKQKVEKLKSIDMYLNEQGITEKVVIKMLNNIFELVKAG